MPSSSPVLPESPTLGGLLRRLRREKRLTQEEAAQAAGIGRVTLARWEKGAQKPRVPELAALLAALSAGPRERREALGLLQTPGALAQVREEVERLAVQIGLETLPGGGDLLRALRRRRGLSAEEAAAGAGVGAWTLRRWEAGEAWPATERLHALCWALGAYPEEVAALTAGEFAPHAVAETPSSDERYHQLDHELDALRQRVALGETALIDLHCLTMQNRAWPLAAQRASGRRLLSRSHQIHAMSLCFRGHIQEGKQQAQRAMEVWPTGYQREPIWFYCGVLVSQGFSDGGTPWGGRRGRETLSPLLEAVAVETGPAWGGLEVWMLSEMAVCLSQEGATDEALAIGEEACRVAEIKTDPSEVARRRSSLAGLLLKSQRPATALTLLDGVVGNTPYHATELALVRAEACLGMGSHASAQDWLREGYRLILQHDLTYLSARADKLSQRL